MGFKKGDMIYITITRPYIINYHKYNVVMFLKYHSDYDDLCYVQFGNKKETVIVYINELKKIEF